MNKRYKFLSSERGLIRLSNPLNIVECIMYNKQACEMNVQISEKFCAKEDLTIS